MAESEQEEAREGTHTGGMVMWKAPMQSRGARGVFQLVLYGLTQSCTNSPFPALQQKMSLKSLVLS